MVTTRVQDSSESLAKSCAHGLFLRGGEAVTVFIRLSRVSMTEKSEARMSGTAFCRLSRMSMTEKSEARVSGTAFCRLSRVSMTEKSEAHVSGTAF